MPESAHKAVVQEEFTRQADAYSIAPTVADPGRIAQLVEATSPSPEARVLDVACGPGFLALAFAQRCREAVSESTSPTLHWRLPNGTDGSMG
jgi:ubiquinone/menaquinone biosynthesis C-methylase UbiE